MVNPAKTPIFITSMLKYVSALYIVRVKWKFKTRSVNYSK